MQNSNISELKNLIDESKSILVVSHKSPDPDAISSTLFTTNILRKNFPDKHIVGNIEGEIDSRFEFLNGVKDIQTNITVEALRVNKPQLVILVDAMNYERTTSKDQQELKGQLAEMEPKLAIIDHHERKDIEPNASFYINNKASSCVEELYYLFMKEMKLIPYDGYETTLLLGLLTDTGHFQYKPENVQRMFDFASHLYIQGANPEQINNSLGKRNLNHVLIMKELLENLQTTQGYNYSYIRPEFFKSNESLSQSEIKKSYHEFIDTYLRNTENAQWGFCVKPDIDSDTPNMWNGSFRAVNGLIDTTVFSSKMNGGGHKPASGFRLEAETLDEALQKIKEVIEEYKVEAYANK